MHTGSPFSMQLQIGLLGTFHLYTKMHLWPQRGYSFKGVRLSRLLAFECTLNHCTFISFFIRKITDAGPERFAAMWK